MANGRDELEVPVQKAAAALDIIREQFVVSLEFRTIATALCTLSAAKRRAVVSSQYSGDIIPDL